MVPLSSERFCEWVLDGKWREAADVRRLDACLAAYKAIGILDPPDGENAKAFAVTELETHQWAQSFASSSQRKCCLKWLLRETQCCVTVILVKLKSSNDLASAIRRIQDEVGR